MCACVCVCVSEMYPLKKIVSRLFYPASWKSNTLCMFQELSNWPLCSHSKDSCWSLCSRRGSRHKRGACPGQQTVPWWAVNPCSLVCDGSPWKCYVIYTAYSVLPFSLFVFIDWKSKNSPAFLVTKLLCFQWINSKKEYSLSIPGKYFLLIQAINFVASDKSRCYDDCL